MNNELQKNGDDRSPGEPIVAPGEPIVEITEMHKWFGDFHVLRNINLTVLKGERIII
jgi:ABC-type transporter Mla maintaining outer membrane lipid asymmetry ATPase subunit MlaF